MVKKEFPTVHFYDQDFVDLYEQTWAWVRDYWREPTDGTGENPFGVRFFVDPQETRINQFDAVFSTFFLVYSNRLYPVSNQLDGFYNRQEENGAIRSDYNLETGEPLFSPENPQGVAPPLFAWAEYNLYHKVGNKKRIKEIMPVLERHYQWLEETFKDETGLYHVPLAATGMVNAPREEAYYPVDFNTQQAMNSSFMAELGHVLNDKDIEFRYRRQYFSLKTRINQHMWDEESGFYYDLNKEQQRVGVKTAASFWTLLTDIPNEVRSSSMIEHLKDPAGFATENPFPTVAVSEPSFSENGEGYRGSVFPPYTFMIIKGLEKQHQWELAREYAIRHLYCMLDTLHPEGNKRGNVYEAYRPNREGKASWTGNPAFPRAMHLPSVGLSTVALMIENVIGLLVSLPRKTVRWVVPTLEIMGIENLNLRRNTITILSKKSGRGWEIRHESEKLYYFTLDLLDQGKEKTLPIPSGKCSMLVDKM
ncbi:MGH1-like glycoside hydrolase domain-containing protein [Alkalispirochaeta alkalica]|uniref:MGH1-like glycoside hydrolase domain-containing protein n=1 Tax=Alkalispirochaeta alkalica TaxID=46356 RepID=UPI00037FEE00|nr:trehalase family glycosidase [Alkalispirochaeta alkalica]